jgi:hypothetical protein
MSKDLIVRRPLRRIGNLGQMDHEMGYGPSPLHPGDVPVDLLQRHITGSPGSPDVEDMNGDGLSDLSRIARDVHSIASTLVLERGLLGRVVTVTSTPQLLINALFPRPYLLLNPAGATGLTTEGTLISSTTAVGATTVTSGELGCANYSTARFFLEVTFGAGVGPVTFDLQTRNPVTGTFITSQTLWSVAATSNLYASVGGLGVDTDLRMLVTVPAGTTITFSVGFVLKEGLEGTNTGALQTIFLGGGGVSPNSGYPLLNGKEKAFYFMENVSLYGVTSGPSLDLNIFEL